MSMEKELKKLENYYVTKPDGILTMYLNTDLADPEQQGGEWKIHFKNGMNNFDHYLMESGDKDEKRNFRAIKEKLETYIQDYERNLSKSLIVFASSDGELFFAQPVQMPVKTEFFWEDHPVLDQLHQLTEQFPKTGVVLVQQENVKILEAELGALQDTTHYELDLNTEDWREATGPHQAQATMGKGGKNPQKEEFEDRFRAHQQRWYKRLAPTLDKMAKDRNWQEIYLVGAREEAEEIESNMNKPVKEVVNKNLLEHEETKVLNEVVL
ncbi:VLRF1 family aeRF1-type release factor [Pontibacillus salicampi]|uniref:VLRF1 family aeRF1-type release factor n=1 Tax=Pontibacillus salicampi TaxID=1449801 RepID=A0ABV6LNE8_9BACI